MANSDSTGDLLDFSQPWQLSDVVLVVEEERLHVHRSILGMWSQVFTTMFTSQFKEKTAKEVPLPGKKANEIKEMLLVIYPTSAKPIDGKNYAFLLDLAKEYMMTKLTDKCENYLMFGQERQERQERQAQRPLTAPLSFNFPAIENKETLIAGRHCLELLDIAQNYGLERLQTACIEKAKSTRFKFSELKNHKMYKNVRFPHYREIVEARIEKIESQLSNLKFHSGDISEAFKELEVVISTLAFVACKPDHYSAPASISDKLRSISKLNSVGELKPLSKLDIPLSNLHNCYLKSIRSSLLKID